MESWYVSMSVSLLTSKVTLLTVTESRLSRRLGLVCVSSRYQSNVRKLLSKTTRAGKATRRRTVEQRAQAPTCHLISLRASWERGAGSVFKITGNDVCLNLN